MEKPEKRQRVDAEGSSSSSAIPLETSRTNSSKSKSLCQADGCVIHANFNFEGSRSARFCVGHRLGGMVNVKYKKCEHQDCKKHASFNVEGSRVAIFCSQHKVEDMVLVLTKLCEHPDCSKVASFNVKGSRGRRFCADHKLVDMILMSEKKYCQHKDCKRLACFNIEGSRTGLSCSEHKLEHMVNVFAKRCEYEGCSKHASFNFEGLSEYRFCAKHKLENMINIRGTHCKYEGCTKQPCYNVEGTRKPRFCGEHKLENMINVKSKKCKTPMCGVLTSKKTAKYDGYCFRCFVHLFPDRPNSRNYKTKELTIVQAVREAFPDKFFAHDRIVAGGCSRRRPDLYLDCGTHHLVVEIDENQHDVYDCSCENRRIMEIFQDLGMSMPLVVIRFNPDGYVRRDKTNVPSPWGPDKLGLLVLRRIHEEAWRSRIRALCDAIHYWTRNVPEKTLEVLMLYFDDFD